MAARLGVSVVGRHTALGDAILTGEIFLKQIRLLAAQGLVTLGEVREAARSTYLARVSDSLYSALTHRRVCRRLGTAGTRPGAAAESGGETDASEPGSDHHSEIDWEAAERSPEFQELIAKRRRFVLPATIFFLSWYFGFILLAGYAEDFMGESVYEGLTVGYVLALTQFIMVWGLTAGCT